MRNLGRKVSVVLGGVALTLLGLDKFIGVSVTPGERTGFEWTIDPSDSAVVQFTISEITERLGENYSTISVRLFRLIRRVGGQMSR